MGFVIAYAITILEPWKDEHVMGYAFRSSSRIIYLGLFINGVYLFMFFLSYSDELNQKFRTRFVSVFVLFLFVKKILKIESVC